MADQLVCHVGADQVNYLFELCGPNKLIQEIRIGEVGSTNSRVMVMLPDLSDTEIVKKYGNDISDGAFEMLLDIVGNIPPAKSETWRQDMIELRKTKLP